MLTFAVQIPLTELEPVAYQAPLLGARTGVGVYASVSRRATTTRRTGAPPNSRGGWVRPTDRAASRSKPTADSLEQGTRD